MDLIKKIGRRKSKTAKTAQSWGLFYCPACNKNVEKNLHNGKRNKTCGCQQHSGVTKHGLSTIRGGKHPLFDVWNHMISRCERPKTTHYKRYGGRGIKVCDEWRSSFEKFYRWAVDSGWENGLQIDRIDNNGNYDPENCRFVSSAENIRNSTIAKLSPEQVEEIRNTYSSSEKKPTYKETGAIYGVTGETISNIVRRKTWA